MAKCYFCYKEVEHGNLFHSKCCQKFFGTKQLPELKLDKELLSDLAKETVNQRISITGVQPKLSVDIEKLEGNTRLTIVGLWGNFILKPQNPDIMQMPEVEDLTMHLAELFKIKTCEHCILPTSGGDLVYLAKRFDRKDGKKIHMEDFCQLGGFQTEQKYHSSYEQCGKLIAKYCSYAGLDLINYFELLIFSFVSGNNDMHMKNFSLLHQNQEIVLSPAYDLINSNLINPEDKEDMALLLSGRKSKIKYQDFSNLASVLGINQKVFNDALKKFGTKNKDVFDLIDHSFLTEDHKTSYKNIWIKKLKRLSPLQ